jgi:hypothetical protein
VYFYKDRMPTDPIQMNPVYTAEIIENYLEIVSCVAKQTLLLRKEIDFLSIRILFLLISIFPNDR